MKPAAGSAMPLRGLWRCRRPLPVDGVAFIEFAVDEVERDGFERLLAAMGFARAGRHRSKDVSLWRQGEISIVVNADPDGFRPFLPDHAWHLGLRAGVECHRCGRDRCPRPRAARHAACRRGRARRTRYPAVRGLGGSLLYFVDKASGLDAGRGRFVPTGETARGVGLTAIDHVSQSMQYEEMLTWLSVLFVRCSTRARHERSGDRSGRRGAEPGDRKRNRASHGQGLRLVLNGSQSHRHLSARFVTEFFGSGRAAYRDGNGNMIATVRALVANGVEMLPIPENYYDDLEARSDLTGAEIDALKA